MAKKKSVSTVDILSKTKKIRSSVKKDSLSETVNSPVPAEASLVAEPAPQGTRASLLHACGLFPTRD